jgi:hypothetical protein
MWARESVRLEVFGIDMALDIGWLSACKLAAIVVTFVYWYIGTMLTVNMSLQAVRCIALCRSTVRAGELYVI